MKSTASIAQSQVPRTKLFYRIQEVARMTGLKPYVLRYWEGEFKELAPGKDRSDQRRYRPEDVEVVLAIRKLLYEDRFTIEGARKRLPEFLRARRDAQAAPATANVVAASPRVAPSSVAPVVEDFAAAQPARMRPRPMRSPAMAESAPLQGSLRQIKSEVSALLQLMSA